MQAQNNASAQILRGGAGAVSRISEMPADYWVHEALIIGGHSGGGGGSAIRYQLAASSVTVKVWPGVVWRRVQRKP